MKKLFTHITYSSRLIVIYLITLLVSGGIMVYLSIQNNSNFRELTDKRILEEEQEIHNVYGVTFQETLEQLTQELSEFVDKDGIPESDISTPVNGLVSDYMIMTKNGALVKPHFSFYQYSSTTVNPESTFLRLFKQGEQLELMNENYIASQKVYQQALREASDPLDSVMAYNTLSRLQIKLDRPQKAFEYFTIIITNFGNELNKFGIPYAYFSVDQMLKMDVPEFVDRKKKILGLFLVGLNSGSIPFTQNTQDILDSLKQYLEIETDLTVDKSFAENLNVAQYTANLIDLYKPILSDEMDDRDTNSLIDFNDLKVAVSQNANKEIFMVANSKDKLYGFIVSLTSIDQIARVKLPLYNHRFDYLIELNQSYTGNGDIRSKHEFQNSFSPFFPNHNLVVTIKSEDQVSDFIFKRMLITIIGLGLLLAAMIIGFFMLVQDVNRKKKMDRLRADFVSNVTHELKTPLTSINMFSDTILMGRAKDKKTMMKYARIIVKESEKLKRMINNILEFSRQENQKLEYQLKEENLASIIHDIMDEMNYWLELNGFEVSLSLDEQINAKVDAEGMKQVLSNLISNAIKYSDSNKKIELRLFQKERRAIIEVEDHGIGIAEEQIPRIFEKFYRIKSSTTGAVSGTGLGLRVSKDIIEAQNGSLTATSTLHKGSTFTITLAT